MNPEITQYLTMINDLRDEVITLLRPLPPAALSWRPLQSDDHSTNSLAVLAAHVAGAEHYWIGEFIGQLPATRNRDAEFMTTAETAATLIAQLEAVAAETNSVLPSLDAATLDSSRVARHREIPVRWAILHAIDHTALHLGHMQLTVQLWRGTPAEMPRWFERTPGSDT